MVRLPFHYHSLTHSLWGMWGLRYATHAVTKHRTVSLKRCACLLPRPPLQGWWPEEGKGQGIIQGGAAEAVQQYGGRRRQQQQWLKGTENSGLVTDLSSASDGWWLFDWTGCWILQTEYVKSRRARKMITFDCWRKDPPQQQAWVSFKWSNKEH